MNMPMSIPMNGSHTFVIGIAGGSASGKTTLANALQSFLTADGRALSVELLGMDRYFRRIEDGAPTLISPSTGELTLDRNHPESADNARLVADVRRRCTEPDAPDVFIIEGLMSLYVAEIRELLDLKLFVQLDADVRSLRRMLRRRGRSSGEPVPLERLIKGINYYRECARPGHARYVQPSSAYADLIVRGDADLERTVVLLGDIVHARMAAR